MGISKAHKSALRQKPQLTAAVGRRIQNLSASRLSCGKIILVYAYEHCPVQFVCNVSPPQKIVVLTVLRYRYFAFLGISCHHGLFSVQLRNGTHFGGNRQIYCALFGAVRRQRTAVNAAVTRIDYKNLLFLC